MLHKLKREYYYKSQVTNIRQEAEGHVKVRPLLLNANTEMKIQLLTVLAYRAPPDQAQRCAHHVSTA